MTLNKFWEFLLSFENEYCKYRKRIMNRYSLTAAETDILMFLANNPCYDTAAEVSKIRHIPKSQVSLSVKSLCEKGLLESGHTQGNRKSIHLVVTDNAEPVVRYGRKVQAEFSKVIFDGFTKEETDEFEKLHMKIADNIEKVQSQKQKKRSD